MSFRILLLLFRSFSKFKVSSSQVSLNPIYNIPFFLSFFCIFFFFFFFQQVREEKKISLLEED
tara:strand:- start:391 stop:579 length:189 start_codon:yes stop_codon:yes gene_type:complete